MLDTHWRHLTECEFRAYQELVFAARSDPILAEAMAPMYQQFIAEWYRIAETVLGWKFGSSDAAARAARAAQYTLDGMAYGQYAGQLSPEHVGGGRWNSFKTRNPVMAALPTETPVTPLRQRMLDDMALRAMKSWTQDDYVRPDPSIGGGEQPRGWAMNRLPSGQSVRYFSRMS